MRYAGDIRSANADISNDNVGENPTRRKPKGFSATSSGGEFVGTYGEAERRSRWKTG